MKEYHFGVILQSRELTESCAEKTGMIVRQVQFARFFRESAVRISKVSSRNHEGNMKYYFTGNVLDGWTFH